MTNAKAVTENNTVGKETGKKNSLQLLKKQKLPTKTTLNLYEKKVDGNSLSVVLPSLLIILILGAIFVKFAVIDRLDALSELQAQEAAVAARLSATQEKLTNYDKVHEEYRRYSYNHLTGNVALIDRMDIIYIVNNAISNYGFVSSMSVSNNHVALSVSSNTLADIKVIRERLEKTPGVTGVFVSNAQRSNYTEDGTLEVTASITFNVEEENDTKGVDAK